jgi:hypothetical protein
VSELEERHAGHERVAAQPGEEGDVTFVSDEPGVLGAGEHRGWQVDKLASAPRTIVNLKVLEELVEGMVVVIQDAARNNMLRLAHGMSVKQFTERYSFGLTNG